MIVFVIARRALLSTVILAVCVPHAHGAEELRVESVLLKLIEQADVPARDPGVIETVSVTEGDVVQKGDTLVQLDTVETRLDVGRAKLELSIAQQESKNDVDVRFAEKSLEVAAAELQRALDSVEDYPKSVSDTELDRLKLTAERTRLEIEQAKHVLAVAELNAELRKMHSKRPRASSTGRLFAPQSTVSSYKSTGVAVSGWNPGNKSFEFCGWTGCASRGSWTARGSRTSPSDRASNSTSKLTRRLRRCSPESSCMSVRKLTQSIIRFAFGRKLTIPRCVSSLGCQQPCLSLPWKKWRSVTAIAYLAQCRIKTSENRR